MPNCQHRSVPEVCSAFHWDATKLNNKTLQNQTTWHYTIKQPDITEPNNLTLQNQTTWHYKTKQPDITKPNNLTLQNQTTYRQTNSYTRPQPDTTKASHIQPHFLNCKQGPLSVRTAAISVPTPPYSRSFSSLVNYPYTTMISDVSILTTTRLFG